MNSSLNEHTNKKAFTVAEMMITMMIAMIVLAAAAPIMTKRGGGSFASLNKLPLGTIVAWASPNLTTPPPNWCFCNGGTIAQASYPDLYKMLGTSYSSNGSSFVFPNLTGRVITGSDAAASRLLVNNVVGKTGGNNLTSLTDFSQLPNHTHTIVNSDSHNHAVSTYTHSHGGYTSTDDNHNHGGNTVADTSHVHGVSYGSVGVLTGASFGGNFWGCSMGTGTTTVSSIASGASVYGTSAGSSHTHTISTVTHSHNLSATDGASHNHGGATSLDGAHAHSGNTQSTGSAATFSVVKPFITMQYIIKCK